MIDVHSHLQFPEYDHDRDEVIARMKTAGVKTITVGVDMETSRQAIALAEQYPHDLWATVGAHPTQLSSSQGDNLNIIGALACHPKVVAVGECGLDYYRLQSAGRTAHSERQKEICMMQMAIAEQVQKPLMIHCRPSRGTDDAYEDLITILSSQNQTISRRPAVIHFFVGSPVIAEKLLTLGCYFTFGGVITFARDYDDVIRTISLSRIMLETDAPYVTPASQRGKRNEPAYVVETAKKLAEIKKVRVEEVVAETTNTARRVFEI